MVVGHSEFNLEDVLQILHPHESSMMTASEVRVHGLLQQFIREWNRSGVHCLLCYLSVVIFLQSYKIF